MLVSPLCSSSDASWSSKREACCAANTEMWSKRHLLPLENLPSEQCEIHGALKRFCVSDGFCSEELWGFRIPESRGREIARHSKPSLQNLKVKASAVGWELTSSVWDSFERQLHPSLTHPWGKPNGSAGGGVQRLVWPSTKFRGPHPASRS